MVCGFKIGIIFKGIFFVVWVKMCIVFMIFVRERYRVDVFLRLFWKGWELEYKL